MGRQPQSKAQRALAIGRKIGELEAEARPLLEAIAELKREHALLFPEDAPALAPPGKKHRAPAPQKAPKEWQPLAARVLGFFEANAGKEADLDTIADAIGHANRQSLRATMVTLYKEGKLRRVGKGVYAPAEKPSTLIVVGR